MRLPLQLRHNNETIKFSIPISWEGITAREYKAILDLKLDDSSKEHDLLPTLTGIPAETWEKCQDIQLYYLVKNNLAFIFQPMPPVDNFDHVVTFRGKVYNVLKDLGNMQIGQWKDIEQHCLMPLSAPLKHPGDAIPYGVLLAAIYLQPAFDSSLNDRIAGRFVDYDYQRAVDLSEELYDMPIVDCLKLQRFFFLKTHELAQAIALATSKPINEASRPE